jgi:branched-chain amino acid transport system substrate-binding protein
MRTRWCILGAITLAFGLTSGVGQAGSAGLAQERKSIRIGYAISKTGANALGANTTSLPNYRLWVHDVNAAGGMMLSKLGKRLPLEVIEYDDNSEVANAVEAVERLVAEDKVDFILAPWGTRLNLAVAPSLRRAGYPHLTATSTAPDTPPSEMAKEWPSSFWFVGQKTRGAEAIVDVLLKLRREGRIGSSVAILNVADKFGIESSAVARERLQEAGFDIVHDRSYPLGSRDLSPLVRELAGVQADTLLAFSYPVDSVTIVGEARGLGFRPKVLYAQVGSAFPSFRDRLGKDAEGVMGMGGWNPDLPASRQYLLHHMEVLGQEPDRWASPLTYATLQMLQQAIERVGTVDRAAVIKELRTGKFETIVGPIALVDNMLQQGWHVGQWQNGEFYGIAPAETPGAHPAIVSRPD